MNGASPRWFEMFVETLRDGLASILNGDNRTLSLRFVDLPEHLRVDVW